MNGSSIWGIQTLRESKKKKKKKESPSVRQQRSATRPFANQLCPRSAATSEPEHRRFQSRRLCVWAGAGAHARAHARAHADGEVTRAHEHTCSADGMRSRPGASAQQLLLSTCRLSAARLAARSLARSEKLLGRLFSLAASDSLTCASRKNALVKRSSS